MMDAISARRSCGESKSRFRKGKGWTREDDETSAAHNRGKCDVPRDVFFMPDTCSRLALLCAGRGPTTGSDEDSEVRRTREAFIRRVCRCGIEEQQGPCRADDRARSRHYA